MTASLAHLPLLGLLREARFTEDTACLIRLARRYRSRASEAGPKPARARVALLSGATTETLAPLLELAAAARGVALELWQGTFGAYALDVLEEGGALYAFRPDLIHFVLTPAAIEAWPSLDATLADVEAAASREGRRLLALAETARERSGACVILDNFAEPLLEPLGNHAASRAGSATAYVRRVNAWLAAHAGAGIVVHDVARVAGEFGLRAWADPRARFHSQQPMSLEAMGTYVQSVAALVAAAAGRAAKLLVLDLDNTLWGGSVGEEGLEGIRLGEGSAEGEAYKAFQLYCRSLKERGVLLAVCSKNDAANARLPFEKHPETVLRLDDFVAFKANWEPKPENLAAIARELELGLDCFVFCDDDAAERAAVEALTPDVLVVAMPDDPAAYPAALAALRAFETIGLEAEDLRRSALYRARTTVREAEAGGLDMAGFLASLEMKAVLRPFNALDLGRIAQLVLKSNQFNLTTRRHGEARLLEMGRDPRAVCFSVRLADRLADHGLVSVVAGLPVGDATLEIDTWVMSCRVLKRGVEILTLRALAERAREKGYGKLRGVFRPTDRNGLVRSLFADLGFRRGPEAAADEAFWELEIDALPAEAPFIRASWGELVG